MAFRENLKQELAYNNLLVKELASRSGVYKRTIDTYLREKASMPPADVAVKLASALGVTVEYLVNGTVSSQTNTLLQTISEDALKYRKLRSTLDDLLALGDEFLPLVTAMIKAASAAAQGMHTNSGKERVSIQELP
jgi:transcriptional regulator with XRE-family HTH domain